MLQSIQIFLITCLSLNKTLVLKITYSYDDFISHEACSSWKCWHIYICV